MMRILLAFVFVFLYSWSTAYAVNIYVSVSGNDSNPGTVSLPLQTVGRAVELAKTHNANNQPVTITLFAGTYREAVEWTRSGSTTDAPILFQASPFGSATISGSDIFSNWLAEPQPNLYSQSWNNNWGVPGSLGEPSGEVTRRREMVFIEGELLTQVISFDALTDKSFYVDEAADKLYIQTASNPNESKVEVGVRKGIFVIRGLKNVTARGIVFQHDTTPADLSAVLFSGVENALVEDCDFLWNTWGGLRVENSDNVTLRRINANHNGGKGTEVVRTRNLLFEDSDISYNNWRGFAGGFTGWSVAGSRHLRIHGAVYRNLIAIDNKARGFWLDFDSQDIVFDGLIALGNIEGGLGVEANQGPITVRNSVICNTTVFGGILASNSENITLENSVLGHNQTGQIRPRGSSGRPVDNWETGEVVELFSQNWTANNNIIFGEGKNELLWYYADSGGDLFLSTYQGDNNIYWNTSPDVFRIQGDNTFGVWQQMTGQEQNSVFTDPTTANLTVEQQRMLDICLGSIPPTPTQPTSNNPPHASFNMNPPGSATLNETTFFDASASFDPDGDPLAYTWDFGDGTSDSGVNVSHTYTAESMYTVTLTVDDGLDSDTAQTIVNVLPEASQDGLIAHWALDESSGTTAPDTAGFADGALINGPVWQPGFGRLQGALEFDGVDDYVDLGALDVEGGTGLTISAWINADDFDEDDGRIISKATGTSGSSHYWMLSTISRTALRFRLKTGNNTTKLKSDTGLLQPGVWYHVAATYDGSTMRIYKDGVEVASTGKTGAVATDPTVSAAIGNQPAGAGERAFDGLIDDVQIYNRALTQIEITALANQ